ncbi:MAG: phosphopantothenoylcysteine decarboxylase [Phycisphaerales bacterium]
MNPNASTTAQSHPRVLIVAGPTHEPIDAVRYIANRSSGRLGLSLADAATERGCATTLLLGPAHIETNSEADPTNAGSKPNPARAPDSPRRLLRFRTSHDLEALLAREATDADILIMAAAVADYRPASPHPGKLPRTDQGLTIALEPVPDLLAATMPRLKPGAVAVGFALEEDGGDHDRALAKMARKGCQAIILNPLDTMDSGGIDATILFADGREAITPGPLPKAEFARRLIDIALDLLARDEAGAQEGTRS